MKDVLVFHYLPILWYRYPIPNDIREFWYKERPDILNFMQKAYKELDIQFLPNAIIENFNRQKLTSDWSLSNDFLSFSHTNLTIHNFFNTELLSKTDIL